MAYSSYLSASLCRRDNTVRRLRRLRLFHTRVALSVMHNMWLVCTCVAGSQVGTGDRSEKIKTYNYKDSRISDHRLKMNFDLNTCLEGEAWPVPRLLLYFHCSCLMYCHNVLPSPTAM